MSNDFPNYGDFEALVDDNQIDKVFALLAEDSTRFSGFQDLRDEYIHDRLQGRAYVNFKRRLKTFIHNKVGSSQKNQLKASPEAIITHHWLSAPAQQLPKKVVGRTATRDTIHQSLTLQKKLLLNGMGGIGKTTLAAYYLAQYAKDYQYLLWVSYQNDWKTSLINSILAQQLGNNWQQSGDINKDFALLKTVLQDLQGKKLLVIDGIDDVDALAEVQNDLPHDWHVLLTSRMQNEDVESHAIEELSMEEAQDLYLTYHALPKTVAEDADNSLSVLVELLAFVGRHTLVVELLAKIQKKTPHMLNIQ